MKGHPYWPAKVIGLGNIVKEKVDVRFFGGHEMWNVRLSNCLLFTKKSPNKNLNDDEINDFKAAMKVLKAVCIVSFSIYFIRDQILHRN